MFDDLVETLRESYDEIKRAYDTGMSPEIEKMSPGVPAAELTPELENLVANAQNSTVTAGRLLGKSEYFSNAIPRLEDGEQPHFLFPLTKGVAAKASLIIESGGNREKQIGSMIGGSVILSDRYVRVVSPKGDWTIPYESITTVDAFGDPAISIQTASRIYYIRIAGRYFKEADSVWEGIEFIRHHHQTGAESESTKDTSLERLAKLNELRNEGALTDEEFEQQKQALLDSD